MINLSDTTLQIQKLLATISRKQVKQRDIFLNKSEKLRSNSVRYKLAVFIINIIGLLTFNPSVPDDPYPPHQQE